RRERGTSEIIDTRVLAYIAGYFLLYVIVIGLSFNMADHVVDTPAYFFGDPGAYMSHAFTIGLDGDLNYENEISALAGGCMNPARTSPCHPMGPGIMA